MATALQFRPEPSPRPACAHHAFNAYETIGGGMDPVVLERGKCCSCQGWFARETDLMTGTVTHTDLDSATIVRLIREQEAELFV